jgi:hypothetical protein
VLSKWLPEAVKTTNVTAAERMVKKAVNIGDGMEYIYKVTNTFGIRSGLMLFLEEGTILKVWIW